MNKKVVFHFHIVFLCVINFVCPMKDYAKQLQSVSRTIDSNPKAANQASITEILQRYKKSIIQPAGLEDEDELLQGKFSGNPVQQVSIDDEEPLQPKSENKTGLPDDLKAGIENMSGYSMDDVKVHYNSDQPAQLNALAYAQGTDIHVAPGQEKHLPHEAWHVVQQKQGRVQPTMQLQEVNVNDNERLEKEADIRGVEALTCNTPSERVQRNSSVNNNTVQRTIDYNFTQVISFIMKKSIEGELKRKYTTLINILQRMGDFGIADNIIVNFNIVENRDLAPAYTNNPRGGNIINLFIEQWFFETADIGEIVAMVSHELGVHFLASKMMSREAIASEATSSESEVIVGDKRYKLPPTSGKGWVGSHGPNSSQKDHIEMAREGSPRGGAYLAVVLNGIRQTLKMLGLYKKDHLDILKNIASQIFSYAIDKAMSIVIQDQRGSLMLLKSNEQLIYNCTLELIKAFPDLGDKDIMAAKEISLHMDMRTWLFDKIGKGRAHSKGPEGFKAFAMSVTTSIMKPSQKAYKLIGTEVESVITESVRDELTRVNYPNVREIFVVGGEGWACYIRCVLLALGHSEIQEQVITALKNERIDISGFGVEIGSDIENNIRRIIYNMTGKKYHVAAHTAAAPGYIQFFDTTGRRIDLVLVGRHFCLLGNVVPSLPQEDIYRVWKM